MDPEITKGDARPLPQATPATEGRRVAVVAVHGVADPVAGSSARAVADLLLAQPGWRSAGESGLHVPLRPLPVSGGAGGEPGGGGGADGVRRAQPPAPAGREAPPERPWLQLDERSDAMRRGLGRPAGRARGALPEAGAAEVAPAPDAGLSFAEGLLERYAGPEANAYATPCIHVRRAPASAAEAPAGAQVEVDVVELHWADLSRAGEGVVRFFGELYQLLLHLPSLGRHAVDATAVSRPASTAWRRYSTLQAFVVRLFTLPIVLLNLLMLVPAAVVATAALPSGHWPERLALGCGALAGVVLGAVPGLRGRGLASVLQVAVAGALGAAALGAVVHLRGGPAALGLVVWLLGTGSVCLLAFFYDRLRPGAFAGTLVVGLLFAAVFFLLWLRISGPGTTAPDALGLHLAVPELALQLLAVAFGVLRIVWLVFLLAAVASVGLGLWLGRSAAQPAGDAAARAAAAATARRTAWTARFSLALPALGFFALTLPLWGVLTRILTPILPPAVIDPWDLHLRIGGVTLAALPPALTAGPQTFAEFVRALLDSAAGGAFAVTVAAPIVFLLLVAVGVAPSVWLELWPPRDPPTPADAPGGARHERLTRGLELAFAAGDLLSLGLLVGLGVSLAVFFGWRSPADRWLVAGSAFLLSVLVARPWLGGARVVLDVLLDVDLYMREHPRGRGPRVRMLERVQALVRHLGTARDAAGRPRYAGVVFVAHSQGSVIVADYLRLARHQGWPLGESELELDLVTLGSPLRQLYERAFPALYAWTGQAASAPGGLLRQLGLRSWTNLYRSGDYVGRELGFPEPSPPEAGDVPIGRGAHTHYWDVSAGAVGEALAARIERPSSR